ncbi:MAG: hypothetical protein V4448_16260 [Pseudomonadota bacterium]
MDQSQVSVQSSQAGGEFTDATVMLNQSCCRLRMLAAKLGANFALIDTVYQRVSLGGMARQSSTLVAEVLEELETLKGLCWAAINSECSEGLKLSFEEWSKLGVEPPAWLREVFETAIILSAMPDEESLVRIGQGNQVLVLRAPDLKGAGLLPQIAALMPAEFGVAATKVWWPWVMGGQVPVVLQPTERANVLQEVSAAQFLEHFQQSAATVEA